MDPLGRPIPEYLQENSSESNEVCVSGKKIMIGQTIPKLPKKAIREKQIEKVSLASATNFNRDVRHVFGPNMQFGPISSDKHITVFHVIRKLHE